MLIGKSLTSNCICSFNSDGYLVDHDIESGIENKYVVILVTCTEKSTLVFVDNDDTV